MAVKDDGAIYPTEAIVAKRARKHYRVPVRSQHWQLRSLISAEKQHIIYFPGGHGSYHIQRLNTITHECETIKLLTFAPRCLVAENGWLCCGSENGDFVAIRLDDGNEGTANLASGLGLDPDSRLPLGLGSTSSREDSLISLIAQARRTTNKTMVAKSMRLAKERVNCITLWFPPADVPVNENAYKEPIAVLANNDRTVTLVSLRDFEQNEKIDPLDIIPYPDYVNRAIISPDGRLLIAILDDPYLYIHQRIEVSSESRPGSSPEYRWELKQSHLLKSQEKEDKSDSRGSFAACFSATINPLITTFTSSRPKSGPGAVRDMAFCPGPYDILAWTEDRGHIGVADLRSNFMVRQVVDINVEADFEHINIFDRNTIDPRLLESRINRRDSGQGIASSTISGADFVNHPLTPSEMRVLEAIQLNRRRREQSSQQTAEEGSRRQPDGLSWAYQPSANDSDPPRPRERSSSVSRAMGDLIGTYRDQRERAQERVRNARQLLREGSDRQTGTTRRTEQRWMDRVNENVAALRDQRDRQDTSYLNVLDILRSRDLPLPKARLTKVVNRWEESAIRGTLAPDHGVFEVPPSPDNTAGLAWSQDGRTLFIGAQNGIYEFKVNVHGRKFCPSIRMR
ncbi:hypothetical protein PT974_00866 [Cladobotryum mycophilum]|uniref:DUF2415 domain-containing protein n=1 Tax=Cladobotryum mycophilum TaxID=491253 RepID=A0ABR0T229_9HYPO